MAGEGDPKGEVKPELDEYFAKFSLENLRQREVDLTQRLACDERSSEAKQWRRALRRVQGTIAAKVQGASGVPTGAVVRKPETTARPATEARPVAQLPERRGGVVGMAKELVGRAVDTFGGGSGRRERVVTDPRGGQAGAPAVGQAAVDVRAAASAGGGGRGPTGRWGVEAEVLGDEEESVA